MKISDLKIDGFGVWRDLSLRGLSPELTVFYGPNEAGKSTLMQFMRSVLYGVSPARREKYLPPVVGGRPGGWLKVLGHDGALTISRYADRGPTDVGKVTVTTADGQEQGDRLLREALEHVDEPTYNNIFAVGLREVQELNTLSDTAAAQWLYRLTSGLDRISLYDVIHMLAGTQLRLLNSPEEKSEIRTLVSRQEQLRGELDELVTKGRRWAQSAVKLRELAEEVERRQVEVKTLGARGRKLEVAINIKPLWIKRGKIDDQLERFANLRPLEEGTIASLDDLNTRIEEHERQRDILKGQRQQLRDEAKRLGINDILMRNGQRLEALLEQQDWLQAVERMAGELADEVKQLEARLASENERLSHEWTGAGKLPPRITSDVVDGLTPQIRAIEATEQLFESAKHELEVHRAGEHQFRAEIESAMVGGEKLGLPKDLDVAGDLVAQLRRRQQVEQRIESARRQADELQEQAQELVDEQVVPMGLFSWLLAVFVIGFIAVGVWYMMPAAALGKYGGWIAAIGIVGAIFAWLFKHFAEDSAADRFDACHRQIEMVADQIDEAEEERAQLDRELPLTDGSVALRLQYAEKHLSELERVMPVEGQRREIAQEIGASERRVKLAEEKHASALANWKARLRALGLPDDISPASLATMAGQCERLAELEARIENRRDDLARRQREFAVVSQRIFALAEETGLRLPVAGLAVAGLSEAGSDSAKKKPASQTPATVTPLSQLDHLRAEYHKHQQRVEQRRSLRDRSKGLRVEEAKHARGAIGLRRRRVALFQKCGVADEQELRQLAAKLDEAEDLRKKRTAATREIAAAIGKHGSEPDFAPLFAADTIGRLEHDFETLSTQLEQLDRELKDALQRRGAMVEQQRAAAADHSLATKQIELDMVDEQIKRAADAWRERAAVSMFLERIRVEYEQHRQPETLREASEYMSKLTGGKYTRIWTPLAHDILFVDTADGQPLSVQVLSRGTREQLFVSLRLALVSAYACRGIHLPMILDDVFVNFDAGRTRTACAVLRDFAKQGHQLLVFTCHEHIWRMFQELKVDTRRIPNRHGDAEEVVEEPQPEPVPEPVAVEPEPVPPPKVVEVAPEPEPVVVEAPPVVAAERIVEPSAPEPEPQPAPGLSEVEYWWDAGAFRSDTSDDEPEEAEFDEWFDSATHPQRR
ncbi:MAG: AAA family ATPase [Planctomycetes bacterium]|nr:AAA family ATPase [Planctomycetota bacterium]